MSAAGIVLALAFAGLLAFVAFKLLKPRASNPASGPAFEESFSVVDDRKKAKTVKLYQGGMGNEKRTSAPDPRGVFRPGT